MNAEQYLNEALGGNMNISTLKPLAWHEIMEGYARHKLAETHPRADNNAMRKCEQWVCCGENCVLNGSKKCPNKPCIITLPQ